MAEKRKPKKWIQGAINPEHKGEFKAKAEKAGKPTAEYAEEKASAPGKLGKQARLATALMGLHHRPAKDVRRRLYGEK